MNSAIFLLFLSLPFYVVRFELFGFPSTLLEAVFFLFFLVFLLWRRKKHHPASFLAFFHENKLLSSGILLFLIGSLIGVFFAGNLLKALGEWRAFYLEPIVLFFLLRYYITSFEQEQQERILKQYIALPLIISGLSVALFAIYQHFTGFLVPNAFWANRNTYRVTAWYGFPNAVGMFLAPLFPLSLYLIFSSKKIFLRLIAIFFLLSAPLALAFAKGSGPAIGAFIGTLIFFLFYKKTKKITTFFVLASILILPFLQIPNSVRDELLFQNRSGQIRLFMWKETMNLMKDHPFIGSGMASYSQKIVPYHTLVNGEKIEIFHHPHNLFLTIFINTGLFGFLGFFIIIVSSVLSFFTEKKKNLLVITSFGMLAVFLTMGLVDSPYIKNDLAFLFWIPITFLSLKHTYA